MAGYSLFFADEPTAGSNLLLKQQGLAALCVEPFPEWQPCEKGPEGKRGLLAKWSGSPEDCKWVQYPGKERIWIGLPLHSSLTQHDLKRRQLLPGEWVELADGQMWYVPIAAKLPHIGRRNPQTGFFERVLRPEYESFYEQSAAYYQKLLRTLSADPTPEGYEISFEDAYEFCWKALSFNYRLTSGICSAMNIVDDQCLLRIVTAVILQRPILEYEIVKKKEESILVPLF